MLKRRFIDGRNGGVFQKSSSLGQCTVESIFEANKHAAGKPGLCEQSNFVTLLKPGFLTLIGLLGKLRLVDLQIEPFQALEASDELGFGQPDLSWCWHR